MLLATDDDGVPSGKLYPDPDAGCEWIFIYDPLGWVVYPTQSAWEKGRGVAKLISIDNDTWQLPQYSLSRSPKTFTFDNLCNILEFLKLREAPKKCPRDELFALLLEGNGLLGETLRLDKQQKSCQVTEAEAFLEEVLGAMDKDEAEEFKDVKNTVKGKRVPEKKLKWKELHQSRLAEKAESRTQRQVCYIMYVNHGLMVCSEDNNKLMQACHCLRRQSRRGRLAKGRARVAWRRRCRVAWRELGLGPQSSSSRGGAQVLHPIRCRRAQDSAPAASRGLHEVASA